MTSANVDFTLHPQPERRDLRLFATRADEPRARRASDVVTLVGCSFALAAASFAATPQPGFIDAFAEFLAAFPPFLDAAWQFVSDLLVLATLVVIAMTVVRKRWALGRDLVAAVVAAVALWLVVGRIVTGSWPDVVDSIRAAAPPPWYPSSRLAICGAIVLTASPHFSRPIRRLSGWILGLASLAVVVLQATTPLGAIAGLLVAGTAAAAVHLLFGSSGGRPSLELVRDALEQLGVTTTWLGAADLQEAGVFAVHATDRAGDELVVKVYGRDAHDASLLSTIWRTIWYREAGSPLRFGRLQQVEHEAFLTLFARQAGVPTDEVVTAGATATDDALLVLRRRRVAGGSRFDETGMDATDEATLREVWSVLSRLREVGVAHGQLDERAIRRFDGRIGLIGFRGATVAASTSQLRTDQVQALVTTALAIGSERAASIAFDSLGREELAATLPYLQIATLTRRQRERVRDGDLDLDDLRRHTAGAAGSAPPALMQLRRITVGSLVKVLLPAVAVVALISGLAGLDLDEIGDELQGAAWWLVLTGFVVAQLPRLTQSISTLGASPVALPLGPVYALQLAVSYINLAIPSSAARIAINIRFFQRHGVAPGAAMTAGAIDGFIGFVVQAVLLVVLLLFSPVSLDLDLDSGTDNAGRLVIGVVVIALGSIGVVASVRKWRSVILHWAKRLGSEAVSALRGLRSPRRLLLLFGGSLATEVLFPLALGCFTLALGYSVGLGELMLINITVALLAGFLPIPGGIGVVEGGLTIGLVQAGMPQEAAFAAVILYRLATFYLPPVWGFFALRWLERNDHV